MGLGLLLIFVVSSPIAFVIAAVALGVSIVILVVRAFKGDFSKRWGETAVISLVMLLLSGGVSDALYDTGFFGGRSGGSGDNVAGSGDPVPPSTDQYGSSATNTAASVESCSENLDFNMTGFEVLAVTGGSMPIGEGGLLIVNGQAEQLYEENVTAIANHIASVGQDCDFISVGVVREFPEDPDLYELDEMASTCGSYALEIALTPDGALMGDARPGEFTYECTEESY